MIDPRSDRPLYQQLADLLRSQINAGKPKPGEKLPSELTLQQEYGLSRDTVRDAIEVLRSEGRVVTERGRGTRVREPKPRQTVELSSGDHITTRMPVGSETRDLNLDPGVPLLEVRRPDATAPELYPGDSYVLTVR